MHGIDFLWREGNRTLASGGNAVKLLRSKFNPATLRPWYDPETEGSFITVPTGRLDKDGKMELKNVHTNADALLTMREWIYWDNTVLDIRRKRLTFWNALAGIGQLTIPNGLRKTVLMYPTGGDAGTATMSMDGRRRAENFRGTSDVDGIPLPLIHADWDMSLRELEVTRDGGMPLDTTNLAYATRKAMEMLEKLALGLLDTYSFGGYTIYGAGNLPQRYTYTMTAPTAEGWTPQLFIDEINAILAYLRSKNYNGPYAMFNSSAWDEYLDMDYNENYAGETLRTRLNKIKNLGQTQTLDYLTGFRIFIIQTDPEVARAISGMDWTPIQWSTEGGMDLHFKLWAIKVPQFRPDPEGYAGIADATTA